MLKIFSTTRFWKIIFWIVVLCGVVSTIIRFGWGLGASTNLSDEYPWGLWVGFDVLCGVALAAGGFIISAIVYIFNIESYRPILRTSILVAFLSYILVVIRLLFELGRPWNFWHPLIMWNSHSVMFEIWWCVFLYLIVLALELSPALFKKLNSERLQKFLRNITIPIVILGTILSTLHQSSLGSLFLIASGKIYPLWYSSNLPFLFFVSSIAVGPAMMTIISFLISSSFNNNIDFKILTRIALITEYALVMYCALKIYDIIINNLLSYVFIPNYEGLIFWIEIGFGVMLPIALLMKKRMRESKRWLLISSLLVIAGVVLNRMNVTVTSLGKYWSKSYFPAWTEISISLMLLALGVWAFCFAVIHLPILASQEEEKKL